MPAVTLSINFCACGISSTHGAPYPRPLRVDPGPHSWILGGGATTTPGCGTIDNPLPTLLAHQRATTVSLACICDLAISAALSTDHGTGNLIAAILIRRSGASTVADNLHSHLLEDRWTASS